MIQILGGIINVWWIVMVYTINFPNVNTLTKIGLLISILVGFYSGYNKPILAFMTLIMPGLVSIHIVMIASQMREDLCEIMVDDDFDQLPSYYRGNN